MAAYEGFAELERRGWTDEGISRGYVEMFSSASDQAIPAIVAEVGSGARVLDLCCGQGNLTEALSKAGFAVVGADFSPQMLAFARKRLPDIEFVEADAQNLPFDDASFDTVTCSFGLMHVPDQSRALREVRRILRPGGQYIMTSWSGPDVSPVFQVFYSSVREHGDPSVAMPESPDFHLYANEAMARPALAEAGLDLQAHRQIDSYWMLDDPESMADIFERGAPRAGFLLSQQPEAALSAIKAAVADKVRERFGDGSRWRAPIPASLITATAV